MEINNRNTKENISEKERVRAMEESCAKLRERIAKEEEEKRLLEQQEWQLKQQEVKNQREAIREKWAKIMSEAKRAAEEDKRRKQQEFKANKEEAEKKQRELELAQEEKRKAWAQKMAAAKLQKKTQKEKEEAEYIENKRKYCIQLEDELKSVGVSFVITKEFNYDIFAPENLEFEKVFSLLKDLNTKQIFRTENQRFYIQHNFFITDLNNEKLIEITDFDEDYCSFIFYQEDREDIEFNKGNAIKQAKDFLFCYLGNRKIIRLENSLVSIIQNGINKVSELTVLGQTFESKVCSALKSSNYDIEFSQGIDCLKENDMLIINYELPNLLDISDVKEYKYIASKKAITIKRHTESEIAKKYEDVLYSITLRSLYEVFTIDKTNEIKGITFNGFVTQVNPAIGVTERKCIISIQVDKDKFSRINLSCVEPKACFKALKGVSAAKLIDITPITPILTFNKKDRRFVEGKDIAVNEGTNLAAMHWEDFEHLVRELFELEFARNGGEVRVTQASRDGGVDAIVFDPDPLRGGKIVIQAKRYTNTVGVSAVRDLYGTVINEGANTGILITTSDYGHDSYEFAKNKPLKLLNGGHLLALLHKNGRNAHINIEEAKKSLVNNEKNSD